ncbi:MAG: hypothetical protein EXR71_07795 [Myxococcales bacterium]|nr:hypothetical protein [Myxococcales bacterium]
MTLLFATALAGQFRLDDPDASLTREQHEALRAQSIVLSFDVHLTVDDALVTRGSMTEAATIQTQGGQGLAILLNPTNKNVAAHTGTRLGLAEGDDERIRTAGDASFASGAWSIGLAQMVTEAESLRRQRAETEFFRRVILGTAIGASLGILVAVLRRRR